MAKNIVVGSMLAMAVMIGITQGWWANARRWIDDRINESHTPVPATPNQRENR